MTTRGERHAKAVAERIELPADKTPVLRRAVRLEWLTLGFLVTAVTAMYLALGSSAAMKAAWVEDLLSFLPPLAFLITNHIRSKEPDRDHPYGFHRSVSIGYLVASAALAVMGAFLIYDSATGLVAAEHAPIGLVTVLGHTFWAGWLMIAALTYTLIPPVLLGRAKLKPARELHDKVLFADAAMNKADWQTAAAGIVGVLGIGMGLWWLDGAAAILIGVSVGRDGWTNLRTAIGDLMDSQVSVFDDRTTAHPAVEQIRDAVTADPAVQAVQVRVREEGHVFHAEVFVVPHDQPRFNVQDLHQVQHTVRQLDWKLHHVVVTAVQKLPIGNLPVP